MIATRQRRSRNRDNTAPMTAYIIRRILFMIPTMFGIMLVSFAVVQFAPGGPVERVIAQLSGADTGATSRISGSSGGDFGARGQMQGASQLDAANSKYRGAQGLDPEFIKRLEKQFGFDKPAYERFFLMLGNYATFDFGKSYFRDVSVLQLDQGEAAGLDLARPVDDAAHLPDLDPARHQEGGARRLALRRVDVRRRHHRQCDSRLPVRRAADRAVRRRLVSRLFPLRGLTSDNWAMLPWWQQDPRLFLAPDAAADRAGRRRLRDDDDLHQELLPRRDPQAIRPHGARQGLHRAPGALRPRLPQRHAADHRRLSRRLRARLLHRRRS